MGVGFKKEKGKEGAPDPIIPKLEEDRHIDDPESQICVNRIRLDRPDGFVIVA